MYRLQLSLSTALRGEIKFGQSIVLCCTAAPYCKIAVGILGQPFTLRRNCDMQLYECRAVLPILKALYFPLFFYGTHSEL